MCIHASLLCMMQVLNVCGALRGLELVCERTLPALLLKIAELMT